MWRFGIVDAQALVVLCLLAALTWWFGGLVVDEKVAVSLVSIVLLAAVALVGPVGAALVGVAFGLAERGPIPAFARLYNVIMFGISGMAAGIAYVAAGGDLPTKGLHGTGEILREIALPILLADVAQVLTNLALLLGIVRIAERVPIRSLAVRLFRSSALSSVAYGAVAFLLVVLWHPAGVGPASVLLVLAPLFIAQWAYVQYAEELLARERALHVLVAAVEVKAPHLAGHSNRVSELSALVAERLGLRAQVVADVTMAGMLHDIGQVTLPTTMVRGVRADAHALSATYPSRGASLLRGLSFLSGSLDPIVRHRVVLDKTAPDLDDVAPLVVGLADEYDLLTEVGTPDGERLTREVALTRLRRGDLRHDDVVDALQHVLALRPAPEVVAG